METLWLLVKYCVQVSWFPQRFPKQHTNQNTIFLWANAFFERDIWGGDCSIHKYGHIKKDPKSLPKIWKKIFDFVWIFFVLYFWHFFLFHPKSIRNHHESPNWAVWSKNIHLRSCSQRGRLVHQILPELKLRQNIKKVFAVVSDTNRNLVKPP